MRQNHTSTKSVSKSAAPHKKGRRSKPIPSYLSTTAGPEKSLSGQVARRVALKPAVVPGSGFARDKTRFDRPGHIAPEHASRLLLLSSKSAKRDEFEMLFDAAANDELATELGEFAVTAMGGGGETWLDMVNAPSEEEEGGPFLETRSAREFAAGSDEDSEGFFREALPTSSAARHDSAPKPRGRQRR